MDQIVNLHIYLEETLDVSKLGYVCFEGLGVFHITIGLNVVVHKLHFFLLVQDMMFPLIKHQTKLIENYNM